MAKRRPSKHLRAARPLSATFARSEVKQDGRWVVQNVPDTRAVKTYLCPGCLRKVEPGVAHLVAWPAEPGLLSRSPVEERRHWHTACWKRRP